MANLDMDRTFNINAYLPTIEPIHVVNVSLNVSLSVMLFGP